MEPWRTHRQIHTVADPFQDNARIPAFCLQSWLQGDLMGVIRLRLSFYHMERSILVHLRMLLRPDDPQHSVFANGLHVVASFVPIVRWLCDRHRDCCTLEVFVVNLETKDTFTGSVLLTQQAKQPGFLCMEERWRKLKTTRCVSRPRGM